MIVCLSLFLLFPPLGLVIGSLITLGAAGALSAFYEKNQMIPAILWTVSLGFFAYAAVYFLRQLLQG